MFLVSIKVTTSFSAIDNRLITGHAQNKPCICLRLNFFFKPDGRRICDNVFEGLSALVIHSLKDINPLVVFGAPICFEKPKNTRGEYVNVLSAEFGNYFPVVCVENILVYLRKSTRRDFYSLSQCSDSILSKPRKCSVQKDDYGCAGKKNVTVWKTIDTSYYAEGYSCGLTGKKVDQTGFLVKNFDDEDWKCVSINVSEFSNQPPFTFYTSSLQRAVMYAMKKNYPQETYNLKDIHSLIHCLKGDEAYLSNILCENELYFIPRPIIIDKKTGQRVNNISNVVLITPNDVGEIKSINLTAPIEIRAIYADPSIYKCGITCYSPNGIIYKNNVGKWSCVSPDHVFGSQTHKIKSKYEQKVIMSAMDRYFPNQPHLITFSPANGVICNNCLIGKTYYDICPSDAWIWYDVGFENFATRNIINGCIEYKDLSIPDKHIIYVNDSEVFLTPFRDCHGQDYAQEEEAYKQRQRKFETSSTDTKTTTYALFAVAAAIFSFTNIFRL